MTKSTDLSNAYIQKILSNNTVSCNGWTDNLSAGNFKSWSDLLLSLAPMSERQTIARFLAKINPNGPIARPELGSCWVWTGSLLKGYGQFVTGRDWRGQQAHFYAHRFVFIVTYGQLPAGKPCVCHRCDTPACLRPGHLFAGAQMDNLSDARAKGRLDESRARRTVFFTPQQRLEIFEMPHYRGICTDLAERYGVTKASISHIRLGRFVRPAVILERVPHVQLPIRGVLHLGESEIAETGLQANSLSKGSMC